MPLVAGSSLGPYRIIEPLGRGGMALVFKAYEARLDRYVALKVLPLEFMHDPTFGERFRREAHLVAQLEHPHIVPIFAYGIDEQPWMAMRLIQGGSLAGRLRSEKLSYGESVAIVRSVAQALDYAHGRNVVHRDVKPQNILLDGDHAYLADFGVARMIDRPGLTETGMVVGTPEYMAPEQAQGLGADSRSDIYALAVIAYQLIVGRVPFSADTPMAVLLKHVSAPIPIPPASEVPGSITSALLKGLAKAPNDRWGSAGEFAEALASDNSGRLTEVESTALLQRDVKPVGQSQRKSGSRAGWYAFLGVGALVVAALVGVVPRLRERVRLTSPPPPSTLRLDAWKEFSPDDFQEYPNGHVTIHAKDRDVVDLILKVARPLNAVIDGDVSGKFSGDIQDETWKEALEAILRASRLSYSLEPYGARVFPTDRVQDAISRTMRGDALASCDAAEFREAASEGLPLFRAMVSTAKSDRLRLCAAYALARVDPKSPSGCQALAGETQKSGSHHRVFAVYYLARACGDDATRKVLHGLTRDADASVRSQALEALNAVGGKHYSGNPMSLDFKSADIRELLSVFSSISGLSIVARPNVTGHVSFVVTNVPWDAVLDGILRALDLGYVLRGSVVEVGRIGDLMADERWQRELQQLVVK